VVNRFQNGPNGIGFTDQDPQIGDQFRYSLTMDTNSSNFIEGTPNTSIRFYSALGGVNISVGSWTLSAHDSARFSTSITVQNDSAYVPVGSAAKSDFFSFLSTLGTGTDLKSSGSPMDFGGNHAVTSQGFFVAGSDLDGSTFNSTDITEISKVPLIGAQFGHYNANSVTDFRFPYDGDGKALSISNMTFSVTGLGSTVPEPTTWAMFIGGFGLIGGAMRQRQRKGAVA